MNVKYCRNGIRRVLLIGKYAVKFPNFFNWEAFLNGLLANMHEKTFDVMKMPEVAPVLFSLPGGWLSVMPRVDVKSSEEADRFEYLDQFKAMLLTSTNAPILKNIVELKVDSVGLLDGRVVAIDYGHGGRGKS